MSDQLIDDVEQDETDIDLRVPQGVEGLLYQAIELVEATRGLPLSSSVKLDNKDELLALLESAMRSLPEELREARWMMKERDDFLARTQREADDILAAGRLRAERMVQKTEVVREAQASARRILDEAKEESNRLRLEAEDYCDQKLAEFEVVLERTTKTVHAGRKRLSSVQPAGMGPNGTLSPAALAALGASEIEDDFFDQDEIS